MTGAGERERGREREGEREMGRERERERWGERGRERDGESEMGRERERWGERERIDATLFTGCNQTLPIKVAREEAVNALTPLGGGGGGASIMSKVDKMRFISGQKCRAVKAGQICQEQR